ncbi:MAG: sensor histidine kinase N-terminal domain-containing protein [Candidatus Thiodiazotropha sp.]|nr:sensor histidine kinase N-terminal domain-containing protein [Candidatus Thiodiazotropha sp.]MCM8884864.1 sensor histidine kinase N-terminal domain-containing protein [Candidatus Thiodiazotropha sp.]MCM8921182.1 sensor histidine kinase N-terminal domain-containing protein [Candidatus Thiodiazotropha sp.]
MIVRSIRVRLLLMLLLSMLLLWIAILCFTWWRTSSEINRVYDAELALVAQLLAVATEHESEEFDLDEYQADLSESGYTFPLLFQVWSHENRLMIRGPEAPEIPLTSSISDGYSDSDFKGDGWRVYTLNLDHHDYRVQVARTHAVSQQLVRTFVMDVIKPLLLVLPLSGILWFIVHSGLKPLREVTRLIGERDYNHLNPVQADHVPEEISGLVDELNALLLRLRRSIDRNGRFTADVAHELRTPIAGMLVQLQSSATGRTDEERERGIQQVKKGLDHLNHVIKQLLILASIEPQKIRRNFKPLDLEEIAQEVLADISSRALSKQIEIELQCSGRVSIDGNRELIGIMLNNLVSNAIKFTPNKGAIALRIAHTEGGASLSIVDAGPGIPDDKKKWVFERLNRLPGGTEGGTGLGLSIVQEICELHQGSIILNDPEEGTGLVVNLFIPGLRKP